MKAIFILLFLCAALSVRAQLHLDWAVGQGSKLSDYTGTMQADFEGNLFTLSEFQDTVDLDPGPGTDWAWPTTSNALVVSKFNKDGQYQWGIRFYDDDEVSGTLEEIKDNRIRLLLSFADSLVYQFQGNTTTLYVRPGRTSVFLNLNLDGTIQDVHYFPSDDYFFISNLITLPNGNTILGGGFYGTLSFTAGSPLAVTSKGGYDMFLAMLDPQDQPIWIKAFGSNGDEDIERIYVANDEIYFAGVYTDSLVVPTAGGNQVLTSNGEDNSLYGYASMDGTLQKVFVFGGEFGDQLRSIAVDADQNIYICGYFGGDVDFAGPGQAPWIEHTVEDGSGFVAKYNHDGELIWDRIYQTANYGGIYTMSLKRGNELYLSGGYSLKADLDPGPDSIIVENNYYTDIFFSKLNLDGQLIWSYALPGSDFEGPRELNVSTTDSKVTLLGYSYDTLDCDPSADQYLLLGHGGSDVFLISYSEDNVISAAEEPQDGGILAYPNPTSGPLQITTEDDISSISIHAIDGRMIRSWSTGASNSESITLGDLPPGMYYVMVRNGNQIRTEKIVKQ